MTELTLPTYPLIETNRLLLRQITIADANDIFDLRSNEEAIKYIHKPKLKSVEEAKELISKMNESERIQWGITLKHANKIIGTIGYHRIIKEHYRAEIGYMLHPDFWNIGIMTEAISLIIDYGFKEMKLHSIEAIINPDNIGSRKVLQKLNFNKEAYYTENFFFEGNFYDSEVYSLLQKNNE